MVYVAEKALSKYEKHALLVYRLASDDEKCYKFQYKRTNRDDFAYNCVGCDFATKNGALYTVKSIRVKADYSEFLADPEAVGHFCELLPYLTANVEQAYRYNLTFHITHFHFQNYSEQSERTGSNAFCWTCSITYDYSG